MKLRSLALALAVSATVGATIASASLGGQTRNPGINEACAHTAWPNIPASCLTGNVNDAVRVIPIESDAQVALRHRFDVAFGEDFQG